MKRWGILRALVAGLLIAILAGLGIAPVASADVKTDEKSQIKFEGMMGRMVGLFGGKAAREGLVTTVAVKGNRKMTRNDYTGQIIDLDEEKVYDLDVKDKTYKVTTFAELRRQMQEAQERAAREAEKARKESGEPSRQEPGQEPGKEVEIDFSLKETGQRRAINGQDCREVLMTIAVREKGKTLEDSGGLVMTSNLWLAPKIPAVTEIADFDQRYAKKLEGPWSMAQSAEQMAALAVMYPHLKQAMARFQAENVNMDGTAMLTTVSMEAVKGQAQMAQEKSREEESGTKSVGGLLGGLGRKLGRKKTEGEGSKTRATILTMNHELLKVSTDVVAADLAVPAGYRAK